MESQSPATTTMARRLWHIVRVVYYMLRKGISKRKLMMDLHLLLKRSKIAGKALGNLMTFHHHHHHHHHTYSTSAASGGGGGGGLSSFSCRSMDPALSFYNPGREVEFSCSNTPSYSHYYFSSKRRRNAHKHLYDYDPEAIARAFEILTDASEVGSDCESVLPSPSPALPAWGFGRSPAVGVRQLRVTDSPFPAKEEEGDADCRVNREADEFIRRFYDQLRLQQPPTPDCSYLPRRRGAVPSRA